MPSPSILDYICENNDIYIVKELTHLQMLLKLGVHYETPFAITLQPGQIKKTKTCFRINLKNPQKTNNQANDLQIYTTNENHESKPPAELLRHLKGKEFGWISVG